MNRRWEKANKSCACKANREKKRKQREKSLVISKNKNACTMILQDSANSPSPTYLFSPLFLNLIIFFIIRIYTKKFKEIIMILLLYIVEFQNLPIFFKHYYFIFISCLLCKYIWDLLNVYKIATIFLIKIYHRLNFYENGEKKHFNVNEICFYLILLNKKKFITCDCSFCSY